MPNCLSILADHPESRLRSTIDQLLPNRLFSAGWDNYKNLILAIHHEIAAKRWLELGAGRFPAFSEDEVRPLGVEYVMNDISERELSLAPEFAEKRVFDIAGTDTDTDISGGNYDLIFSKMLFEHIPSTEQAYRNALNLLRDGGVIINFHPVLYAPPFVLNKVLSDGLTKAIVRTLVPHRNERILPKFPAHYDHCRAGSNTEKWLRGLGFRHAISVPFYGHAYYRQIGLLHRLSHTLARTLAHYEVPLLASFCYTIAQR
jgi:SAM-dependent methyltransferase